MTRRGKVAIVEDAFSTPKTRSGESTPARSRGQTPAASRGATPAGSVAATPAGSDAEGAAPNGTSTPPVRKKKKPTRNQIKARDERRKARHLKWLIEGGPKPEDTDSD